MFHKKNVDFVELIWEDFQYQIDFRQSKLKRREIMPYPRFTKLIINHFISQHKSLSKLKNLYNKTIKDDGILNRLKFVRTGEDFQEYGRAIPDTMLAKEIKQSETYQTFLALSTGLITPKKTRGKGSKGKKEVVTPKKKGSISADDNIILKPDVAFELRKSMNLTEAEEEEAARRVHATHERLVTEFDESDPEPANRPTGRRRPYGIAFRDTSRMSKKKSLDQSQKLKGIQTLTAKEQLAADTMQALNASKKISKSQSHTGGSSERVGVSPEVPDESTGIFTTSSEGTENKCDRSNEAHVEEEEIEWLTTDEEEEKQVDQDDDDRSINIEETDNDEKTDDEFVHGKDNKEITDAEKTEATKGDHEQAGKLPPTSSSLSISSGFGNQILNLSSDISLIGTVKDSADVEINSLLDIQIQQEVPSAINEYLRSSLGDTLQKVLQKHTEELKQELQQQESQKSASKIIKIKQEQASKQKWPKHSSTPFDKTAENEYK
ncbi:hypothetical protein Tco_0736430 [Tanacetum coccineum]